MAGGRIWTLAELAVVHKSVRRGMSAQEIAHLLRGRTKLAVEAKIADMDRPQQARHGTPRPSPPRGYSAAELAWARANLPDREAKLILVHHQDRAA